MLFINSHFTASAAILGFASVALAQDCNPMTATCNAIPGIVDQSYSVDFTQTTSLPAGWTLANYANVTFGPNGAEFTLHQRHEAPYIWTDYMFFGSIEIVAQAASGQGIVSTAVLMSDDLDEIDWEFSGNNFGYPTGRVQTNYFGKGVTAAYDRGTLPEVASPSVGFHTYTIDWTSTELTWMIDGAAIRTLYAADGNTFDHQYPQTPSRFHLGLWAGGDPDNAPGTISWAGGPTDFSQAPFTFYVKSVRITNMNPCASYIYSDQTGSAASVQCLSGNMTTSFNASPSTSLNIVTSRITDASQNTIPAATGSVISASMTPTEAVAPPLAPCTTAVDSSSWTTTTTASPSPFPPMSPSPMSPSPMSSPSSSVSPPTSATPDSTSTSTSTAAIATFTGGASKIHGTSDGRMMVMVTTVFMTMMLAMITTSWIG